VEIGATCSEKFLGSIALKHKGDNLNSIFIIAPTVIERIFFPRRNTFKRNRDAIAGDVDIFLQRYHSRSLMLDFGLFIIDLITHRISIRQQHGTPAPLQSTNAVPAAYP